MVLIGLALFFFVLTTRPEPLPGAWRDTAGAALTTTAAAAVTEWERGGRPALSQFLTNAGERSASRFWLFDDAGRECSGTPMPPNPQGPNLTGNGTDDGDFPKPPPPPAWRRALGLAHDPPPGIGRFHQMRDNALQREGAIFGLTRYHVMATQSFRAPSGKLYVVAAMLPRPTFGRPAADPRAQWLGAFLVLGLSGLICYGLVRYLTAPLVSLRAATGRLAAGDLTARTHAIERKRRDEVADVGRDFDLMAERIESLVLSQQQLLGDISHELRSPLSRLSMALALARRYNENRPDETQMSAVLERIGYETTQLNTLIGQLLELARLETEAKSADAEPLQLDELVREVVENADFEARENGSGVRLVKIEPCRIIGSRALLWSALENVIRNAVRYAAAGTQVEVSLQQENCADCPEKMAAIIRVRDWGPGVPEEELGQLFRPFYRVADARDRESGGVGLGLAITERAVDAHGGSVVASNAQGGGLLVEISLPLKSSEL